MKGGIFHFLNGNSCWPLHQRTGNYLNHLQCRGNYSATSNNMKLVHWPLMGGQLHLV